MALNRSKSSRQMISSAHEDSSKAHLQSRPWEWWLISLLTLTAAGFGAFGQWRYDVNNTEHADLWSIGYHTLQLFILHAPHLDHSVPWQLHLGRWLAAIATLGTVFQSVMTFRSECRLGLARLRGKHIVICGLGRMGTQLATEFRRSGRTVVAIESNGSAKVVVTSEDFGVIVIEGDPSHPSSLKRAGIRKASKVIAACDDEQKNVAIAITVGDLVKSSHVGDSGPECWMFVLNRHLRDSFQQNQIFPHSDSHCKVNVRGLDVYELAARQVLREAPLDYELIRPADTSRVHLVIVGFGPMGTQLALQSARIGHFANLQKLRITVLEQKGSTRPDHFLEQYSKIKTICDFSFQPVELPGGEFDPQLVIQKLPTRTPDELMTIAACWDSSSGHERYESDFVRKLEQDDPENLGLALALTRYSSNYPRVLVFQTRHDGFAALFPKAGRGDAIGRQIRAFGMLEDIWSVETLLHEQEDRIAMALHQDYLDTQRARGLNLGDRPAMFPWEQLAEHFKNSNRRAADHIPVKLRAVGYRMDGLRKDRSPVMSFDQQQIDLLAKMEHESWCAEWLLQGYSYAPGERNAVTKTHPYLVPWSELSVEVRGWDSSQAKAIPEALRRVGYGIYPQIE